MGALVKGLIKTRVACVSGFGPLETGASLLHALLKERFELRVFVVQLHTLYARDASRGRKRARGGQKNVCEPGIGPSVKSGSRSALSSWD